MTITVPVIQIRVSSKSFLQRWASELKSYTLKAYAAFKSHGAPDATGINTKWMQSVKII